MVAQVGIMEQETYKEAAIRNLVEAEKTYWNLTSEMWLNGLNRESTHFDMLEQVETCDLIRMIKRQGVDEITSEYIRVLSGSNAVVYIWADKPCELWNEYNNKSIAIRYHGRKLDTDTLKFTVL